MRHIHHRPDRADRSELRRQPDPRPKPCCRWVRLTVAVAGFRRLRCHGNNRGWTFGSSASPALFPDMRTPCTQGIPLHHQLMRDPTVQFSRNRPHNGSMRHLIPNSEQGDLVSRRRDPHESRLQFPQQSCSSPPLATTNHGKQLGHLIYERRQPSEPLSTNA